jgi:hypothetical protein
MGIGVGFTEEGWEEYVRHIADSRCRNKHIDVYDSLICVGPGNFGPPCSECIEATRKELEAKRDKMHGTKLSPEEAEELNRMLDET